MPSEYLIFWDHIQTWDVALEILIHLLSFSFFLSVLSRCQRAVTMYM